MRRDLGNRASPVNRAHMKRPIESLSSSERARARARANHAKNDAQKGCAGDSLQLHNASFLRIISCVISARTSGITFGTL